MIDIRALNETLAAQDEALRARFAEILKQEADSANPAAWIELLAEGLAAIHERQGNQIVLMLQSAS